MGKGNKFPYRFDTGSKKNNQENQNDWFNFLTRKVTV
jgi:hypothetical protein